MPYADVTKRRTYHAGYMQQWRARKAQQRPSRVPTVPNPEASRALVDAAQRLHTAALELRNEASLANNPLLAIQALRKLTGLLVEISGLLVNLTESRY